LGIRASERIRRVLVEIKDAIALGDDILHEMGRKSSFGAAIGPPSPGLS
jgi:hypothetical protein